MIQENLLVIAILVFVLMFIGIVLTVLEFSKGSPKQQELGNEELQKSPHGDV